MGSTIHDAATQHWAGKALSLSNERWLKRALGAALNRDRSNVPDKQILEIRRAQRERMRGLNDVSGNLTAVKEAFQALH